jgi:hypothetical protein
MSSRKILFPKASLYLTYFTTEFICYIKQVVFWFYYAKIPARIWAVIVLPKVFHLTIYLANREQFEPGSSIKLDILVK